MQNLRFSTRMIHRGSNSLYLCTVFIILDFFKDCVETKASKSVAWVNNIKEKEARKIVKSVFDKCYSDLEPFGRKYNPSKNASKTFCSDYLLYNQYKRKIKE